MSIELVFPTVEYSEQITAYRNSFVSEDCHMVGCGLLRFSEDTADFLRACADFRSRKTTPADLIPTNQYLAIRSSDKVVVGLLDVRHSIDHPFLSTFGGHIGYSVLPEHRGKGFASEMLRLGLIEAGKLGISQVLITCAADNEGSRRVIIKHGGVFEHTIENTQIGEVFERYWLELCVPSRQEEDNDDAATVDSSEEI